MLVSLVTAVACVYGITRLRVLDQHAGDVHVFSRLFGSSAALPVESCRTWVAGCRP
jgi:hypothetical protein